MTRQPPSTSGSPLVGAELERIRKELIAKLADPELMAKVHRAVEACARVPRGSLIARELVAEVVDDTYRGELRWGVKTDFMTHVLDEVRRQLGRTARKRANHVSLDELREDLPASIDAVDERRAERDVAVRRARVARARRQLEADGDPTALQLLTFYELGVTRRRDLRRLGLAGWKYRAAQERLTKLFASMDSRLTPDTEQETEHPEFRSAESNVAVTPLTGGHRIGPKRADIGKGHSSGAQDTRMAAPHRRSRKRPPG